MIKLEGLKLDDIIIYLNNRETVVLTSPFEEIVDNFKGSSQYWVFRYVGCCYPVKYNCLYKDKTLQMHQSDIKHTAKSIHNNILEGHYAYVVTESELNSLKILNELIN